MPTTRRVEAAHFPEDSTAKKIYNFALKTFLGEITYEICADGVDNEASTCYHHPLASTQNFRGKIGF